MQNKHLPYLCAWAATDKLTLRRYQKLKTFFGNLKTAWLESSTQSLYSAGLDSKFITEFLILKQKITPERELNLLQKHNLKLVFWEDDNYPILLREITQPPIFLFLKGSLQKEDLNLAVVGARQMTTYGKHICQDLIQGLVYQGLTIVSGLALGIDALAHISALKAQGRTIAVLGNGLDQIYPVQNQALAEKIIQNGAIISEFPLATPPHNYNFPRRNRLISGLSLGTLVIEAKIKSGSLITARNAIEQNREVFAIPGSIYNTKSSGTNLLIQKGEAKLVTKTEEIIEELNLGLVQSQNIIKTLCPLDSLGNLEKKVISEMSKELSTFDSLLLQTSLDSSRLSTTLTFLEMKGFVSNLGNNQWVKIL